jgi:ATP-binding cassette, subfamily F, member 3
MAELLQLQGVSKSFGAKELFQDATFSVAEGEHVGVIGPNGAGKTTLFKILIGAEALDTGDIIRSRQLRLGYLSQHDTWHPEETPETFLSKDCIRPLWTLKQLAQGLGLTPAHFSVPISSLSGGYRMRVKLLYLIGQDPNLMLLDEPTNYLDLETLMVLENFLQGYSGAFLLISHDREFLRRTTSQTLEVESGDIIKYPGNIDDYFEQKSLLRTQLSARAASLADKRKEVLDFVARFGAKASKASQAQSRLKSLDKMESIELKPLPIRAHIRIPKPARTGKLVMDLKKVAMGYPQKTVIDDVNLQIASGDHIAVVGLNGAGKSTLLKTLTREIAPIIGSVEYGYEVTVGYYAQHVTERLSLDHTVLEAMQAKAHPSVLPQEVMNLAGSLLFSGNDIYKKIALLSGGERARVALGQILLQKCTCLILDEPTNHLDFDTVEALTQALAEYPGTVIIVSHDRSFTRRVGTKILEINHGKLSIHFGTYDDYVWRIQKEALGGNQSDRPPNNKKIQQPAEASSGPTPGAQAREQRKQQEKQLRQLERTIENLSNQMEGLSQKIREINQRLVDAQSNEIPKLLHELNAAQTDLHPIEERWIELSEKREKILIVK